MPFEFEAASSRRQCGSPCRAPRKFCEPAYSAVSTQFALSQPSRLSSSDRRDATDKRSVTRIIFRANASPASNNWKIRQLIQSKGQAHPLPSLRGTGLALFALVVWSPPPDGADGLVRRPMRPKGKPSRFGARFATHVVAQRERDRSRPASIVQLIKKNDSRAEITGRWETLGE